MTGAPRIAILGATGHIGFSLLHALSAAAACPVLAYARRPEAVTMPGAAVETHHIDSFGERDADVVINCTGAGDPARVQDMGADLFRLTSQMDDRIISFLVQRPERLCIAMSSGAVYGTEFAEPARADSTVSVPVNAAPADARYGIIKRHAEARHRAVAPLNIVDIRVFNYVSPFLNRRGRLFIVDLANALLDGRELETAPDDPVRDYATPAALAQLIRCIIARWQAGEAGVNDALDLYTSSPVAKFELLSAAHDRFGLRWRVRSDANVVASTGRKSLYFSKNRAAARWGYAPVATSLEGVMDTLCVLMERRS